MFSTSLRRVLPSALSVARNVSAGPVADARVALANYAFVRGHRSLTTSAPRHAPAEALGQPASGSQQTIQPLRTSIDVLFDGLGQNPTLRPYIVNQKENPEEVWRKRSQDAQKDATKARDAYYGISLVMYQSALLIPYNFLPRARSQCNSQWW
jgi:hypothetical protein